MNIITARKEGFGTGQKTFLDMELYVAACTDETNPIAAIVMNPTEDMFEVASNETDKQITIEPLLPMLLSMSDSDFKEEAKRNDDPDLYVITNKQRLFGAGAIASKRLPGMIKEALGTDDVYILPSSIHELLVMKKAGASAEELRFMVRSINETQVAESERLSNNVYEIVDGKIVIAA